MKRLIRIAAIVFAVGIAAFLIYNVQTFLSSSKNADMSRKDKDALIEASLRVELPVTDAVTVEEAHKVSMLSFQKVRECEYEQAISIVLDGLRKYPTNFELQDDLAYLLSDCAEVSAPEFIGTDLKKRMMHKSD